MKAPFPSEKGQRCSDQMVKLLVQSVWDIRRKTRENVELSGVQSAHLLERALSWGERHAGFKRSNQPLIAADGLW